jgi:chromosome segregation ATPase
MAARISELTEQVSNLEARLNVLHEKFTTGEEDYSKLLKKLEKKSKNLARTTKQNNSMESEY